MKALSTAEKEAAVVDPWYWAFINRIELQAGSFSHKGHEYLAEPMRSTHPDQVKIKGAQMGFTEIEVLKTLQGMIYGRYPAGVLYLFPTSDDVSDFSRARFAPLTKHNPHTIGAYVQDTDAVNIKRIGKSMLYLRGAKATRTIEGLRRTATKLKSVPVDRIVYDERDEMDQDMVDLALARVDHSAIREISKISTPTIPDYGVDREYKSSTGNVWMIRCQKCGKENVLEVEFPNCLGRMNDGRVIRMCVACHEEIFPWQGRWIEQWPSKKEREGWMISQLNSAFVSPKQILDLYERLGDPGSMNAQEFYNSKLARAYVDAANRLTRADFEKCVSIDSMHMNHQGPCAMGVDVGKYLHVGIAMRPDNFTKKLIHVQRLSGDDWNGLYELGLRFGLHRGGCCVIDGEPERAQAREFQANAPFAVYLADYQEHQRGAPKWDVDKREVVANRFEMLDRTHSLITHNYIGRPRVYEIPQLNSEVLRYIEECCNLVKVRVKNENLTEEYVYKQVGPDHYRHVTIYLELALERVGVYVPADDYPYLGSSRRGSRDFDNYADDDPLSLGRRPNVGNYSTNPF